MPMLVTSSWRRLWLPGAKIGMGLLVLLHLPARASEGVRVTPLPVPVSGHTGFTRLDAVSLGIRFTNVLAQERHLTNQILLNGSGVAAGDVDGDGRCDLYFCALDRPNALFKNLGHWTFQDVTAESGTGCPGQDSTGAVLADLDGDGDLDLVVNSMGKGTRLFLNDGRGHFREDSAEERLNAGKGGMSLALADVDGDGDLDLYVANYRTVTLRDQPNTKFTFKMVDGQPVVTEINGRPLTDPDLTNRFSFSITLGETKGTFGHDENGEADVLFRNEGQGRFQRVSFTDGSFVDESGQALTRPPFDWGLSVMFRDLNGDGAPDLYVCNDFKSPDRIWLNDGRGRFRALPARAIRQTSLSSMGVDVADVNRDGYDDIFVVDMLSAEHVHRFTQRMEIRPETLPPGAVDNRPQYPRNTLQLNRGDGTFAEEAQLSGLEATDWSWTPVFLDVDLDGFEDVLVANGFERDGMNADVLMELERQKRQEKLSSEDQLRLRRMFPRLDTPNLAFRNLGRLQFEDRSEAWGFHASGVSQGMALADLDNDGDLDVVVTGLNEPPGIYRNETAAPRLAVRLKGTSPNTKGIGARLTLRGGPVTQTEEMICGGRYLSGDDALRVFAAGPGDMTLEVAWRDGKRSVATGVRANHLYEVDEAASTAAPAPPSPKAPASAPLFQDVSTLLGHTHQERVFDDFALQPLLSHRQSQSGPGVSWYDLDGDGWEDAMVGGGRGSRLAVFRNNGQGGFEPWTGLPFSQVVTRDQTAVLGWRKPDGKTAVLAGSSNYKDGLALGSAARIYDLESHKIEDALPGQLSSTGPLALADLDGDGDLDLLVGGRVVPGRFPEPASSLILRQNGGAFMVDPENSARLEKVGLVRGAVWSDLDGDGDPDLILACHWGPIRVFLNEQGRLREGTDALGLGAYRGWWNGVATGDFDGDGRMDIVGANWGRNTPYERFRKKPLRLYYGDLDGNGTVDTIEAYQDAERQTVWPLQQIHQVAEAYPLVRTFFSRYEPYARATLPQIYGEALRSASLVEANWLESTVFLNRDGSFEAHPLPLEAQLAPAFGLCVADADGDGREDLFLSQNFFAVQAEHSRYDAGRGLWLKGDGHGGFVAWPGAQSGVVAYGEQRGAAVADYDGDGRIDLLVGQNAAETKLFHNVGGRPGLRVRLKGPPGNPDGIGALLRLVIGPRKGPAREVQAGSGYDSQNGAVQVLAAPETESRTGIWVRWSGGKEFEGNVPENAKEIVVSFAGGIEVIR
jgi:enediyne biosynthesis protein E4